MMCQRTFAAVARPSFAPLFEIIGDVVTVTVGSGVFGGNSCPPTPLTPSPRTRTRSPGSR
jgi:hypothetical protein